jgi:uncharacterized protein YndB with AHSA1/START domain
MTTEPTPSPDAARFERTYDAPAELIRELWTTAAGLGEWFAPDGFESRVSELELTQQHRAHRGNELDNLEAAIRQRTM